MRRYNDGMIYTNDRCVACNHCVHVCPAVGANVSAHDETGISIDVSNKNCIHCGACIRGCVHKARQYRDSLDDMLLDIKRGTKISVIVDPAFIVAYGREYARHGFGYLKYIGINGIYDGSIGGDISLFSHIRYLRDNMDENGKCWIVEMSVKINVRVIVEKSVSHSHQISLIILLIQLFVHRRMYITQLCVMIEHIHIMRM